MSFFLKREKINSQLFIIQSFLWQFLVRIFVPILNTIHLVKERVKLTDGGSFNFASPLNSYEYAKGSELVIFWAILSLSSYKYQGRGATPKWGKNCNAYKYYNGKKPKISLKYHKWYKTIIYPSLGSKTPFSSTYWSQNTPLIHLWIQNWPLIYWFQS